jgi:flagellar hook-length control protein FliK
LPDSTAAAAHGGAVAAAVSAVDQKAAQPASGQAPVADRQLPATPQPAAPATAPADPKAGTTGGGQQKAGTAGQDVPQESGTEAPVTTDAPRVTQAPVQPQQAAPAVQASSSPASPILGGTPATQVPAARGGFAPPTPVPLARAAEAVEHVLQLASQRGVTHARIALHPQELGSIDVHLRSTSEGIVARVVAHAPEAAQQLQQAAADLRKSLEQQGLTLLNLDIGHQGDGRSAGRAGAGADGSGQNGSGSAESSGEGAGAGDETSTDTSLQLPNGVLVDVLA